MSLPAEGGTYTEIVEPNVNPLAQRYWQTTDVFIRDYWNPDGSTFDCSDPAVGLGNLGLLTPFAADGSIRSDLFITSDGPNLGFYHPGELEPDTTEIAPDITVQQTPTAQSVRTTRNVITKLDDALSFTPLEANPVTDALHFELPLYNLPAIGTPGYQVKRGPMDYLQDRVIIAFGTDGSGQLMARVLPRCQTNKKGKIDLGRKKTESGQLTFNPLFDPNTGEVMWICRDGVQWRGLGGAPTFSSTAPVATAVSGDKATVAFTTPTGDEPYTYTVLQQVGGAGEFTSATLQGSPTVNGSTTTLTVSGLTTSSAYVFKVVAEGANDQTATSTASNSITAVA
ncbi:hypothetical protein ABW16_01745 [Mycolicibacter heraklionensis]|uniref:Fibronectin type-III domain-containing protein n=1 Tax=Mycolicibacter heraklionensis TaxID=512402 RepID=A0ABR5FKN5_9MYCO|nr:fibronectin type III domain-containing protein [Mycolicibacter heraklionensis]KLO31583.1 hypothetical protein ABW16_01745 [Mycolicibacter heraklionensis]